MVMPRGYDALWIHNHVKECEYNAALWRECCIDVYLRRRRPRSGCAAICGELFCIAYKFHNITDDQLTEATESPAPAELVSSQPPIESTTLATLPQPSMPTPAVQTTSCSGAQIASSAGLSSSGAQDAASIDTSSLATQNAASSASTSMLSPRPQDAASTSMSLSGAQDAASAASRSGTHDAALGGEASQTSQIVHAGSTTITTCVTSATNKAARAVTADKNPANLEAWIKKYGSKFYDLTTDGYRCYPCARTIHYRVPPH